MNIFVGNLSFNAKEADVKTLFDGFGDVASVTILMRDNKKKPKSRGFGFVQMPDEQQALAAIAALNGKEFMGRVINVEPARPKTEAQAKNELKKKEQPKPVVEVEQGKKTWFSPVFNKPGTYKGGRRTRSYMQKRGLSRVPEENKPRSQDNPMRWRKKKDQPKPWQNPAGDAQPWRDKSEGSARPWKKAVREARPWKKPAEDVKSWKKSEGEFKSWKRPAGSSKSPWSKSKRGPSHKSRSSFPRKNSS